MQDIEGMKQQLNTLRDLRLNDIEGTKIIRNVTSRLQTTTSNIQNELAKLIDDFKIQTEHVEMLTSQFSLFKEDFVKKLCAIEDKPSSEIETLLQKSRDQDTPEKALKFIELAIRTSPTSVCVHCTKAQALKNMRDYEQALQSVDTAIEFAEDKEITNAILWSLKGYILFNQDKFAEAILAFRKSYEFSSDYKRAIFGEVDALISLKQFDNAEERLQELLDDDKIDDELQIGILCMKSFLLEKKSNYKAALEVLNKAKSLMKSPAENAKILSTEASIYYEQKNYQKAADLTEESLKLEQNIAEYWANHGLTLLRLSRPKEALNAFKEATKLNPNLKCIYCRIGLAHNALKDYKKTLEAFQKEVETGSTDCWEIRLSLSQAQIELGQHQEAQTTLLHTRNSGLLQNFDSELAFKSIEIELFLSRGKEIEAKKMLETVIKDLEDKSIENQTNLINIAVICYKVGEYTKGEAFARRFLEIDPIKPEALNILACCIVHLKKEDEALEIFKNLVSKTRYDYVTVDVFADLCESRGEHETAEKIRKRQPLSE